MTVTAVSFVQTLTEPFITPTEQTINELIACFSKAMKVDPAPNYEEAGQAAANFGEKIRRDFHFDPNAELKDRCCTKFAKPSRRVLTWEAFERFEQQPEDEPYGRKQLSAVNGDGLRGNFRFCRTCPIHPERPDSPARTHDCRLRALGGIEEHRVAPPHRRPNPVLENVMTMAALNPRFFHQLLDKHAHNGRAVAEAIHPGGMEKLEQIWQHLHTQLPVR